jgi:transposase
MSHSDYTRNILNIKDKNIIFEENCLEERKINNNIVKIFHGKLTYTPTICPNCNCLYQSNPETIIKYGFKKNCKIKIDKISNYKTILLLDKQRFFCKYCHSTFIAETDLVDFHKQVSNNTKASIILDLMKKGSEKDIALRNNVSSSTVNRILDSITEDKIIKNNGKLPDVMGIDEFKATSDTISKMAFIIVDQNNKNIFDINNSRLSKDIEKYFKRYSKKERNKVKFITMDLYKPYYKLMHSLFKNAILIPDRFHIVIQVRNALDKTRIKLCVKSNPNYKKLKKYWKLILKDKRKLDKKNKSYQKCFKKEMTQQDIVSYLLNTNEELYETYQIYQSILYSLDIRNKEIFLSIINGKNKKISKYMKKALNTFKNMKDYILNAFDYDYSNGIVEGTNNLIKQIKHSACGYRKFTHLKSRVMLVKGLLNPIKA